MRVPDTALDELRDVGFSIVERFLEDDELAAAQDALWEHYPRPDDYFADPDAHQWINSHQFAGLREGPFEQWALNRLSFHPDLVDAAERFLGTTDVELYKIELWGKYSGATSYDQGFHRDFGNHSLVVPQRGDRWPQLTTFILLSDVTELDAPTALVPRPLGDAKAYRVGWMKAGAFADEEVLGTGPAGSLLLYQTDVLHRGTDFGGPARSRFALLADFQGRGATWNGKVSWPGKAMHRGFAELMVRASVRERDLFGWPRPGDDYWNDQTLTDVAARYPGIDLSPYAGAQAEPLPGRRMAPRALDNTRPRLTPIQSVKVAASRWARGRFHGVRRRLGR